MYNVKRGLAAVLAVLMLVAVIPFGGMSVFAGTAIYVEEVFVDSSVTVTIENGGDIMAYEFAPTESGSYVIYSTGDFDTVVSVCDYFTGEEIGYDDQGAGDEADNFRLVCELEAGERYEIQTRMWSSSNTGSYEMHVARFTERLVKDIQFHAQTVSAEQFNICYAYEETGEEIVWKRYEYDLAYDVYYTDGSVDYNCGDRYVYTDNGSYYITLDDGQSPSTPWSGGEHVVVASIPEIDFESSFVVTVNDSEIASITVEPIEIIVNTNGYYGCDGYYDEELGEHVYTPEYWSYHIPYPETMTITLDDGTVIEDTEYNGYGIQLYYPSQSYENPWTVGNSYAISALLYDHFFTYEVQIVESPVVSVTVEPIVKLENYDGYYRTSEIWDEENQQWIESPEYFYYHSISLEWDDVVITLKDGTVIEGGEFEWNGSWYGLDYSYYQSYDNRLQLGANEIPASIAGYDFTYTVEIVETPVERVEVDPIVYIEGTNGNYRTVSSWDEETQQWVESPEFFFYHFYANQFTVYLKDGSVYESGEFEWNGNWYWVNDIENEDDQTYENQWGVGTHTQSRVIAGYEFDFEVEIVESPVASITVGKVSRFENSNGYYTYDEYWDEESQQPVQTPEYFCYHTPYPEDVVITLKDGTVIENSGFEWNGEWYGISTYGTDQSYENQWTAGNTYEVEASLLGYRFTYEVEIVECPVASVTVQTMSLLENADGYYREEQYYDEELDQWVWAPEYFYYHTPYPNADGVVITLKDGTVIEDYGFYWDDEWHSISVWGTDQRYDNPWTVGNTYEVEASLLGYEFTFAVEIIDTPVASVTVEPIRKAENTDGEYRSEYLYWDEETGTEVYSPEYFYYYGTYPSNAVITLKDGTVVEGNGFYWNDNWYSINYESQSYENQLTLGKNEIAASIAGYEFTYTIEIVQLSVNDSFEYLETEDGIIITDSYIAPETLEIPAEIDGVPVIGVAGLCGDSTVKHLIFPDSVQTIGDYLLSYFDNLETVTFGSGVRNLRADMFAYSYHLSEITVAEDNPYFTTVDGVLYNEALDTVIAYPVAKGDTYEVPDTVINIDALSAYIYSGLTLSFSETHPYFVTVDGVTYNKEMTVVLFCAKNKAGSYTMPDTVTEIAPNAFEGCDQLTEVIISSQVTEIVYCVFASCASLEKVELPNGLISIDERAFEGSSALESIELPETLEYIGVRAFANSGLTSLTVPDSVGMIDCSAFIDSDIVTLDLGEGVVEIYESAFANTPVTAVVLPDSLQWLGGSAFQGCHQLKSLSIGSGLSAIMSWTFANTGLESVSIPGTVEWIDEGAFAYSALAELELNEGVVVIYGGAFRDCDNLTEVTIPDSVRSIGAFAFYHCDNLNTVVIGDGVEDVGVCAFAYCPLTSLDLGDALSYIPPYAFESTELPDVFIPDSVTDIMYGAFMDCSQLTAIELPLSVETIEFDAFANCESLTDVYYQGTEQDRANMAIDEWGNEYLLNATWHYGWTNEKWDGETGGTDTPVVPDVPDECEHVYDNACDADCNECGNTRIPADHIYDNACDADCNVCGDNRVPADHVYDNACDADCNECGNTRIPADHVYDNDCDADCNECGDIRVPADHVYDNDCDADCNECGDTRTPADHVYDDDYDADCNECGDIREVPERPVEPDVPAVTDGPLFIVDGATAKAGDTFTVALRTEGNTGIVSLMVQIGYDAELLELLSIEGVDFVGTDFGPLTNNPIAVNWIDAVSPNNTTNGTVALLTFKVKENAPVGFTAITLTYDPENVYNSDIQNVTFGIENGTVEIIEYIPGDVNDDGKVNNKDLGLMQRYISGWDIEINELACDVNADGKINNKDLGILQRYISGWDIELQ